MNITPGLTFSGPGVTIELRTVPFAPTITGVSNSPSSPTSIDVAFTAPSENGGADIISYTAVSNPGNISATVYQSGSGTVTVSGLTLSNTYTFTVYATNYIGNSAVSNTSNSIYVAGVPGAPTIGTPQNVSGSSTSIDVPFTATTENNGSVITSYSAISTPGNIIGTLYQNTSGTIRVTGLTQGTTYSFRVYATNAIGNGAYSANSLSILAARVPNAPTITSVTNIPLDGTSIDVAFVAPTNNGGSTITSYTAVSNPDNITATISQSGSGTIRVTGLTQGTTYTFTVYASNLIGNGTSSSPSNNILAARTPYEPTITGVTSNGPGSVSISFTAPTDNGGSTITSYVAVSNPDNITATISQSGSGSITMNGLSITTSYTFVMYATNVYGTGPGSVPSNSFTIPVYIPPTDYKIDSGQPPALTSTQTTSAINETTSKLFLWGANTFGQLGNNTIIHRSSPVQLGTDNWKSISNGQSFNIGLREDSTIWAWGNNTAGQLGQNDLVARSSPVQIGTSSWIAVFAASAFVMAIRLDSTLWTWGLGTSGQLGINSITSRSSPIQIGTGSWRQLALNNICSFGIDYNYKLFAWGNLTGGLSGQNITTLSRSSPVQIGTSSWAMIASKNGHALALSGYDNTLWAWGSNLTGQLGTNSIVHRSSPVQIGTSQWQFVATNTNGSYAINLLGKLYTWGNNNGGQLGNNDATVHRSSPVQIGNSSWNSVAAGASYAVAKNAAKTLFAWGNNSSGQLGTANLVHRSSPVQIGSF